jgi:hypothetical protein
MPRSSGAEQAHKLRNPTLPPNALIHRGRRANALTAGSHRDATRSSPRGVAMARADRDDRRGIFAPEASLSAVPQRPDAGKRKE